MRAIPALLFILALSVAAEESKPTLADTLEREKRGELDNSTLDAADQIDAARDRFYRYYADSDDVDERKAIRAAFKAVAERILERARQRVREAEERLEQLEQRQLERRAGRSEKA
jgi:predicted ribosome quality control (RQC) complex YloA/Tae2 family protein